MYDAGITYQLCFCPSREPSSGGVLCGVMRIGLVAKGLLIKGDMDLELVLMCRDKPTQTLLDTVCHNLPAQIEVNTDSCKTHNSASHFLSRVSSLLTFNT